MTDTPAPNPPGRPEADPDPLVKIAPGVWLRRRYLIDPTAAARAALARNPEPTDPEAWTDLHNR